MAELVDDEVFGGIRLTDEDRPVQRVAVEPSQPREHEEPWGGAEAHPVDPHRCRIPVEQVQACLRPDDARVGHPELPYGVRISIAEPSRADWKSYEYVRGLAIEL